VPRDDFLVFGNPHIGEQEIAEVVATLRSGWLGTGPRVARFEDDFRTYKGAAHALGLNSCTAALHVALLATGVQPGDEVITTPLTFAATANAIVHAGATPVFADVDPVTMNLDPAAVEAAITERTRAIVPVHMAGRACDMDALGAIVGKHDLLLVEDCAHAIETTWRGVHAGRFGDAACFSFYVTKNVVTGEGGMLITPHAAIADRAKVLSLHGMTRDAWRRFGDDGYRHYEVVAPGYKYNMMDLQAAIGLHQLAGVEGRLPRREEIWARYDAAFADLPCEVPAPAEPDSRHARHLYTLLIDPVAAGLTRDEAMARLHERRIGTGLHYAPLHLEPYYAETFAYGRGDFPAAERIGDRTLSLPLSAGLSDEDVEDVIAAVRAVLG
jgi:dTDP-4-amino-4,6-dideoxygalactose transaminase